MSNLLPISTSFCKLFISPSIIYNLFLAFVSRHFCFMMPINFTLHYIYIDKNYQSRKSVHREIVFPFYSRVFQSYFN
uniref:Ovule protein n=1 Tax=Ascaris lumbricoides TaxID=6252 RepID=A0A0M3IJE8_ASCLU